MTNTVPPRKSTRGGAFLVGAGILISRLIGLVRERCFAHYFGNTDAADVFRVALRIPNFLQNLFGEGALSASFIPVYAGLCEKNPKEAARVAGIIFTLLSLVTSILVLLGTLFTPQLIGVIAAGFTGEKREASINMVRILFPGVGFLVLSAFCLGVLNSHKKFFIPYAAPVLWSGAMIAAMVFWQNADAYRFAENLAWGAVVGSLLQLFVQIPSIWPYLQGMRPSLDWKIPPVITVITRFFPTLMSRGVVQISTFFESLIASYLPAGALASIGYAQLLYTLPTSLFGSSIAASSLIEMSVAEQKHEVARKVHQGMRHLAFFIMPSAFSFLCLGHVLTTVLFLTGKFQQEDVRKLWMLLAASAIGLMASTQGRLLATAFYALKDSKTPLKCSIVRVVVSLIGASFLALALPRWIHLPLESGWATAGIPLASSLAALLEFYLLRRYLTAELSLESLSYAYLGKLAFSSAVGSLLGALLFHFIEPLQFPGWISGGIALGVFGMVYLGLTIILGIEESVSFFGKIKRRLHR